MTDFKFEFGRPQIKNVSEEKILDELEKVAKHFNYNHFRRKDFNEIADIHSATVERHFNGSWSAAILALKKRLERKNIIIAPSRRRNIPEKELFDEMERIWVKVGHRPSRGEWEAEGAKISHDTYDRYFKSWQNACLQFIEYKSGGAITIDIDLQKKEKSISTNIRKEITTEERREIIKIGNTRTIPLGLRLKILNRDNFRCVFCGKSPATDIGTKLHIDHIVPFSKGGQSTLDNLQTLCFECNIGKGNKEFIGKEDSVS